MSKRSRSGVRRIGRMGIVLPVAALTAACQRDVDRTEPTPVARVVISELLFEPLRSEARERFDGRNFGPYLEVGEDPALEYVELFNREDEAVELGGWTLSGGISFVFPELRVEPRSYVVVAADPATFMAYHRTAALGPFAGRLKNAAERIALSDARGVLADEVSYSSLPPWPVLPGVGGHSLERVASDDPRSTVENWRSSKNAFREPLVGGGSPGAANSVARAILPAFVSVLEHAPLAPLQGEAVTVTARVAATMEPASVELELSSSLASTPARMPMFDDGDHGDGGPRDGLFGAIVAGAPAGTLTHYRVLVREGDGTLRHYPYEDEPAKDRAFYHRPSGGDDASRYHLFIAPEHVDALRAAAESSPRTNPEVDATLVIDGIAHPHVRTSLTGRHLRASEPFAWHFKLNPDAPHDGVNSLRASPYLPIEQKVIFDAFERVGLPSLTSTVAKLQITSGAVTRPAMPHLVYEVPNGRWLERQRYSSDTELYKARSVESASPRRNSDLFYFGDLGDERADNGLQTDLNYWGAYGKVRRPLEPPSHVRALVAALNGLSDEELLPWLDQNVDLDEWFRSIALHIYLRIDDFAGHNYYLLLPGGAGGKWQVLNYDFDSFARFPPMPALYASGQAPDESPDWQRNKLHARVRQSPTLSRLYLLTLRKLLDRHPPESLVPAEMVEAVAVARQALLDELSLAALPAPSDAPAATPCGGLVQSPTRISVSAGTGWQAYFTVDGSDPRLSPTRALVNGDVELGEPAVLRAAAAESGRPLAEGLWTDDVQCVFTR